MKPCENEPFKQGRLAGINPKRKRTSPFKKPASVVEWLRGFDDGRLGLAREAARTGSKPSRRKGAGEARLRKRSAIRRA